MEMYMIMFPLIVHCLGWYSKTCISSSLKTCYIKVLVCFTARIEQQQIKIPAIYLVVLLPKSKKATTNQNPPGSLVPSMTLPSWPTEWLEVSFSNWTITTKAATWRTGVTESDLVVPGTESPTWMSRWKCW